MIMKRGRQLERADREGGNESTSSSKRIIGKFKRAKL